jgi:sec-independent protein translocase protein TatB
MFGSLGLPEIGVLIVCGMLLFGPERLPKAAADAARLVRRLRAMADGAMNDMKADLGPEFADLDLASLHPHRLISRALADTDADADEHSRSADRGGDGRVEAREAQTTRDRPRYDVDAT